MKTAVICGKNATILDYPKYFHKDYDSYGLNEGSEIMLTKYAICGHTWIAEKLINKGIKTVVAFPTFEGKVLQAYDKIGNLNMAYNLELDLIREIEKSDGYVKYYMQQAKEQAEIFYPNYYSILHLALYYLIKKGYEKIYITGCNLDNNNIKGYTGFVDNQNNYAKIHLDKMIRLAKELNIEIINVNNYKEWVKLSQ